MSSLQIPMKSLEQRVSSIGKGIALLFFLIFSFNIVAAQEIPARADTQFAAQLKGLIDEALRNNPSLKAASHRIEQARASSRGVSSLDPPQFSVEFYDAPVSSFPNPLKGQMEIDYSLEQMIPFPGKLKAMSRAEKKRESMYGYDMKTLEADIVKQIRQSYYEMYLIDRRIAINDQARQIIENIISIVRTQYEVGTGKQADILRAQTELSSLQNKKTALVQERGSMESMINALRNRSVDTPISAVPEILSQATEIKDQDAYAMAERSRPELRSMQSEVAMKKAEKDAAIKEWLPDFMVRGMYKDMAADEDRWSLMFGITLNAAPWSYKKYSALNERAKAGIKEADEKLNAMKNMVDSDIRDALLKVRSFSDQVTLTKQTIIPQAEQTLESATALYRTGSQDFTMLLDAERMLLMTREDYQMAVMNYLSAIADLERAAGTTIDNLVRGGE